MADTTDINKAGADEFQRVSQVSEEGAQAIVQKREELGGFSSWEQIQQVTGISTMMIESLKDAGFYVTHASTPAPRTQSR
ncbi:ComEA family DNA-binding protein [Sorangium sp. So ce124]|uniref:ComEA family DNA-binding protein n=1 Tax=Sorangium sp. So ce124 TaxID=3133280 RepID=UPI003F5ECF8D